MPTIPSLLGSYIDETYPRLVQVSGSSFADGLGNPISFGGATVPGGPINSLQYNKDGTNFTGSSNLTFDGNNLQLTGSLNVTQGITGSLFGTASWATNFISASNYVLNSQTSSFVQNSQTSSFVINSQTGSFATTGSNIFKGNQTISGSQPIALDILGSTTTTRLVFEDANDGIANGLLLFTTAEDPRYITVQRTFEDTINRGILNHNNLEFVLNDAPTGDLLAISKLIFTGQYSNLLFPNTGQYTQRTIPVSVNGSNFADGYGDIAVTTVPTASFLTGTATNATNAATSSNILGGKATHIPFFITDTSLATSSMYQSGSNSIIINSDVNTTANPEALYVQQTHPTSFNVISGKGNLNNYLQLNIHNTNAGTSVSSDVVATANNGDENSNYIDMGINGSNFSGIVGGPNDAYLYTTGSHLHIGNATPNMPVQFFAGGTDTDTNRKFELNANNQHNMTGSLEISGSLSIRNLTTSNQSNVLTYNSSTGQVYYTASSAIGGGTAGVTQILTGSGVTISPSTGIGVVTISATGGGGGDFVTTSSFNNYTGSSSSTFAGIAATASYATNFTIANTLTLDTTLTDFYAISPSTTPGINNLFTKNTGSYTSAFGKYTIYSGSNSRAGEFVTSWNGTTTTYYDNATTDIGSTVDVTFTSAIVTGQIQINTGVSTPSGWQVKMLATFI